MRYGGTQGISSRKKRLVIKFDKGIGGAKMFCNQCGQKLETNFVFLQIVWDKSCW